MRKNYWLSSEHSINGDLTYLGHFFYIYTDHCTLENFNSQKDLSYQQLCWQEFMSQYDLTITYICSEDNTVADALSQLPPNCFPGENSTKSSVNTVLKITSNIEILEQIKAAYLEAEF